MVDAPGLLVNDSHLEGDAVPVVSDNGSFEGNVATDRDGGSEFAPDRGFTGLAMFFYWIVDELGRESATTAAPADASYPDTSYPDSSAYPVDTAYPVDPAYPADPAYPLDSAPSGTEPPPTTTRLAAAGSRPTATA